MRYQGKWYTSSSYEKLQDKQATSSQLRISGSSKIPPQPRDLVAQSGPSGVLLTWKLPEANFADIAGWRVYKDNESTLFQDIRDRGTRQAFVPATSGTTPPTTNFFISSINVFGTESAKIQIQATAAAQTGAPSVPTTPPGYSQEAAGGGNRNTTYGISYYPGYRPT